MAVIISIAIQKGGSGKTTTALNLGAALRNRGKKVLLLDLDPQCNLTQAMGIRNDPKPSLFEMFDLQAMGETADFRSIVRQANDMDFAPASIELAKAELKLVSVYGREKLLAGLLSQVRDDYDFVLLDCPPTLGMLTINSLVASDYILAPMQAEYLPMKGLVGFMETYQKEFHGKRLNENLKLLGILFTRFDMRNNMTARIMEIIQGLYPAAVFQTHIRPNIAIAKAQEQGLDIFQYDAAAPGAVDYAAFTEELLMRLKMN